MRERGWQSRAASAEVAGGCVPSFRKLRGRFRSADCRLGGDRYRGQRCISCSCLGRRVAHAHLEAQFDRGHGGKLRYFPMERVGIAPGPFHVKRPQLSAPRSRDDGSSYESGIDGAGLSRRSVPPVCPAVAVCHLRRGVRMQVFPSRHVGRTRSKRFGYKLRQQDGEGSKGSVPTLHPSAR